MTAAVSFAKTDISGMDNVIYPEDAKGQVGGTATIKVYLKGTTATKLANFQFDAIQGLPDGVTFNSATTDLSGYGVVYEPTGRCVVSTTSDTYFFAPGTYCMAELTFDVDPSVLVGDYEITIPQSMIGAENPAQSVKILDPISATLTIQRAIAVDPLDAGYGIAIFPRQIQRGDVVLDFAYKAEKGIKYITMDVELPPGIYFVDSEEWDKKKVTSALTATKVTGEPTLSHSLPAAEYPTTATINFSGTYSKKSQKYLNESDTYVPFANISACVMTAADVDDWEWDNPVLGAGVHAIKLSNIVMTDIDGGVHQGEYMASLFMDESKGDAILYGHYNDDAKAAAQAALKGGSADITEATVDGDLALNDVLVYGKTNTSYSRNVTAGNYGTICLPYALASDANVQYYTLSNVQPDKVVFAPADNVVANKPALFKTKNATISSESTGYCLAKNAGTGAEVGGLQLTGTYAPLDLAPKAGYYVSDNKLYNDGATVAPFRAYLAGTAHVNGLRIFIDGETGLEEITDQLSNDDIYNLQGVKLQKTQKGVNIVGGKKIFVK